MAKLDVFIKECALFIGASCETALAEAEIEYRMTWHIYLCQIPCKG